MNEIAVFENEQFGTIRTLSVEGEPWFVAADVCRALEINNPSMAIGRLDEDEKSTLSLTEGTSPNGGNPNVNVVNEPGLYSLVLGSRKPEAKAFKRWITHEVIPAIRKTGAYKTGAYSVKPMTPAEMMLAQAKVLVEQERQIREIREEQAYVKIEQTAIRDKVDNLESKFEAKLNPTVGMDWYAIAGYIGLMKYRVNPKDYSPLGKLATKLSKEKGYPMGSAPHPVYGTVHTYHTDILEEVFERYRRSNTKAIFHMEGE